MSEAARSADLPRNAAAAQGAFAAGTAAADIPAKSTTAAIVAVGSGYNGTLETGGDADWIKVSLVAGQTYAIALRGTGSSSGMDTILRVFDPASTSRSRGTVVAMNDDVDNAAGILSSAVTFRANQTGIYYIEAKAFSSTVTGPYQITVATVAPPDNTQVWTLPQIANYLTATYWGGAVQKFNVPVGGVVTVDLRELDASYQAFARTALQTWSDVTGLRFTESTSGIQIRFTETPNDGAWSSSTQSSGYTLAAIVNVEPNWASDAYTLQTFIHEIGHALGLGHAGPYNGTATFGEDNVYANDSWQATVMSYFDQIDNTFVDASFAYLLTPMLADVIAIRALYNTAGTTRTGDSVYGYASSAGGIFTESVIDERGAIDYALTIVDDGGTDTINLSGSTANNRIDLRPASISNTGGLIGNLSIAPGTIIENAIGGSGRDTLIGNDAANALSGGGGNDMLEGGGGTDTATYSGNMADWAITGDVSALTVSNGSQTDTLVNVEYLRFADMVYRVSGVPVDVTAPTVGLFTPADGASAVLAGSNIVVTFSETIARGSGIIQIRAGSAGGALIESFDAATSSRLSLSGTALTIDPTNDLANSTVYFVTFAEGSVIDLAGNPYAGTNIYDFTTGQAGNVISGGAGNDTLTGTTGVDILSGLGGNDLLTGAAGIDILNGGEGSDIYFVAAAADHPAAEFADSGTSGIDEVRFTASNAAILTLFAGDIGIERAVIGTGIGATASILGMANSGINAAALNYGISLVGNAGANLLTGGTGNDTLTGNGGSDTFRIVSGIDTVTDLGAGGADSLYVASGATVNAIAATAWIASAATVNLGSATIVTNGLAVNLAAVSATAAESHGFVVRNTGGAAKLTGSIFADQLIGGTGADKLAGGGGDDVLRGAGGKDLLTGGGGADQFIFDTTPNASSNTDTITDFVTGSDVLVFSKAVFTGLETAQVGVLGAEALHSGAGVIAAHDATDRFVYNTSTGALYYDVDGVGGAVAVQIGLLGATYHPTIAAGDILIIA